MLCCRDPATCTTGTTFLCRGAQGDCDTPVSCSGAAGAPCPAAGKKPNGTACTDDGNVCTTDICNGIDDTCQHPAGNAGALCRASVGPCDVAETCTGASTTCPVDAFKPRSTVCRPSAGECDIADTCTGSSPVCPGDNKKSPGTGCTDDGNVCTLDQCDGTNDACQHPAGNAGAVCRPSAGPCDVVEKCTGSSPTCSGDDFAPASTVCRPVAGVCDVAENCTGSAAACPPDTFLPNSMVCRPSAGICDLAENCTGSSASCPPDAKSTAVCRPARGQCDQEERCDGWLDTCPPDALRKDGEACETYLDVCSKPDSCQGGICVNTGGGGDPDHDGYCSLIDNCPNYANPPQADTDNDGVGDACDNCPDTFNPQQCDGDGDRIGDLCNGQPVPPSFALKRVRLRASPPTKPGRERGTITIEGTFDATEVGGDVTGIEAPGQRAGVAVEVRGAGLSGPEIMWFDSARCGAVSPRRYVCVGEHGESLRLRRKASTNVFEVTISANHCAFFGPLTSDAVDVTFSLAGVDRRDRITTCRHVGKSAVATCKK